MIPRKMAVRKVREHRDYDGQFAYSYADTLTLTSNLTLTFGLGADRYQQPGYDFDLGPCRSWALSTTAPVHDLPRRRVRDAQAR